MDGFSETAREHNSGMRDGASKLWVLVREKVGKVETAGEDKGSEFFNGADEQDAKMKISNRAEYFILSVYFPMAALSHRSVCYLIWRPLSMSETVLLFLIELPSGRKAAPFWIHSRSSHRYCRNFSTVRPVSCNLGQQDW